MADAIRDLKISWLSKLVHTFTCSFLNHVEELLIYISSFRRVYSDNSAITTAILILWLDLYESFAVLKKNPSRLPDDGSVKLYADLCRDHEDHLPLHIARLHALDSDKVVSAKNVDIHSF